jgi:two-component system, OmpR family, sensor histidine kinase BaeS
MKLRLRLSLTVVAVTIPMVGGLIWIDAAARHRAAEDALAEFTFHEMVQEHGRERCEADPAGFGGFMPRHEGHGPPPREHDDKPRGARPILYAYDGELRSQNPKAPPVDEDAARQARAGREVVVLRGATTSSAVEILVRMPWRDGPCQVVRSLGSTVPGWVGAILPSSNVWMTPLAAVFLAMLLAVGPVVQRIRRLTEAVGQSARGGYARAVTIEGHDEIAELAQAFDAAGTEIRAQLAEKDRREQALRHFLANTTHDMMIPLTVLQGHLAALQEKVAAGVMPDAGALVSAMDEAHYMASLLHNLGVAAKLDAQEPQLSRSAVDLNALVARVIGRHKPIARRLEISLESSVPEPPLVADADVTLLEQAVSNVVYNAIRHNRAGGHVAVILERRGERGFRLRVLDDGPGIPPEQLSRLAERGFRGDDARTRSPEGQGLGLDITYRVAQLHGLALAIAPSEYGGLQVDLSGDELARNGQQETD